MGGRGSGGGGGGGGKKSGSPGGPVESAIRKAYNQLAPSPGAWVGLADIRDKLGEKFNRSEVDTALRGMLRDPAVRIIPVANTRALKQRDRDSAVNIGDEMNHAINIGKGGKRSLG